MTVNEIYQSGLKLLENNNIENSKFEAQSLLQKAFSLDRVGFIIHKTDKADENCSHNFLNFIERRISGEPLQYILGEWSFMGFDFKVGRGVLIPRDDTEVVVNLCIDFLKNRADKKTVDLCSGSGAIAVALDKISGAKVTAVEIDETAFSYLETNVKENNSSVKPVMADALKICDTFADGGLDLIVSNPPYSIKWEGSDNGTLINDPRFSPAGVLAPKSKADFAFIMHCLSWLATDGTAAIVCFPGIMYRSGAEQKIRKYLIDNNFIECIIQLPDNLFYGTSIATCIMVLKKSKVDNQTLFIDASKEFIKSTNSNKLGDGTASNEPNNIQNILNAYINRKTEKHFTALVKQKDIENADYNLSVSTYVESEDTREAIDIAVLNKQISEIVQRENTLRAEIDAIIAEIEEA